MNAEGTSFFKDMQDLAVSSCNTFGQVVTFTQASLPTVDVASGVVTAQEAPLWFTGMVAVLPVNSGKSSFDNQLEMLTLAGKKIMYVIVPTSIATFEPKPFDTVEVGDEVYQVVGSTPNPSVNPVVYGVGLVLT
jgi:hypothetical protein